MKRLRSILATLLVVVLLCSLLPASVLAASGYTVSLSSDVTEVVAGESVSIAIDITSSSETAYNSVYAVLNYDAALFEFQETASSLNGFGAENTAGQLVLSRYGSDVSIAESPDLTLCFKATKLGENAMFSLSSAKVDKAANAAIADAPEANIGDGCTVSVVDGLDSRWSGTGTQSDPYLIRTPEDMMALCAAVNAGSSLAGRVFRLEADLTMPTLDINNAEWTPANGFSGVFDGNGLSITVNIDHTDYSTDKWALFRVLDGGTIKNLTVKGDVKSYNYGAGIAAKIINNGKVVDCVNYANVTCPSMYAGGIAADVYSALLSGCVNYGTISAGKSQAGGIVAQSLRTSITDCINRGQVTTESGAGGIVDIFTGDIRRCINYGDITTTGSYKAAGAETAVGGIAAWVYYDDRYEATISSCGNKGTVTGCNGVGGIIGIDIGTATRTVSIEYSYNRGTVTANGVFAGGIVGKGGATIYNCYNAGSISATGDDANYAGGIVGGSSYVRGQGIFSIHNCHNYGTVSCDVAETCGGIAGAFMYQAEMDNCYSLESIAAGKLYNTSVASQYPVDESEIVAGITENNSTKSAEEFLSLSSTLGSAFSDSAYYPVLFWEAAGDYFGYLVTSEGSSVNVYVYGSDLANVLSEEDDVSLNLKTGATGVNEVQIQIANTSLNALSMNVNTFVLTTDIGTIAINSLGLVRAVREAEGSELLLRIIKHTDNQFEITLVANGRYLFTETGTETINIILPYMRQGNAGTVDVKVYCGDEDMQAVYLNSTKQISFTTAHLSVFDIKEEEKTAGNNPATGDASSSIWDGVSIDVSWYDPASTVFYISTPAQLMGLSAIVNGLYNEDITNIVGNPGYIEATEVDGGVTGAKNLSTPTYHFGADDFNGKTVYITADMDMGGVYDESTDTWSGPNYMPIGGQYLMTKNDETTKLSSSFNGTLDGQGHYITNIYCDRHCETGNYGDGSSVGLIGRLGCHDGDAVSLRAVNPSVKNLAVTGYIYGNRSVGGIVGKIGKTAFNNGDESGYAIIENCANYAFVKNTDAKGCGGIVGAAWNGAVISNCYNAGKIVSTYVCPTAGIAGSNEVYLENCYNIGEITAASTSFAMGIGTKNGDFNHAVINCWYLNGSAPGGGYFSSGTADNSGAMSSADMKKVEFVTTLGDAFSKDTKNINNGYPVLKWQLTNDTTPPANGGTVEEASIVIDSETSVEGGTAVVSVEDEAVQESIKAAEEQGADTVIMQADETSGDTDSTAFELPVNSVEEIGENDLNLRMEASDGSALVLDSEALKSIAAQAAGDTLQIIITPETLKEAAEAVERAGLSETELENGAVFEVKILSGNKEITEFDGKLTLELPAGTAFEAGKRYRVIQVSGDGRVEQKTGVCVLQDGKLCIELTATHLSTFLVLNQEPLPFTDIDGHWAYDAIAYAYYHGLFKGTSDTTFEPQMTMSRAMLVTVLHRMEGEPKPASEASVFEDVPEGTWYTEGVTWAAEMGIVEGYGDGNFGPTDDVTREQMAAILYRYSVWKGYDVSKASELAAYEDKDEVHDWALTAMQWANAEGLIIGRTETTLVPRGNATRAEVATILMRYLESFAK